MSEQRNSGDYHRADPAYQRQMKIWLAVTCVAGVLALAGLHLWLRSLSAAAAHGDISTYQASLNRLLVGLCLLLAATAAGFGQWLYRMARASKQERRWPPASMRTSADVRIRYLTSADSLVVQLKAAAFALATLAVLLSAWAVWLLKSA